MQTSVVVIGAGPGGLSMSYHLTGAGVDHVLLERGELAHSWRTERWDSLRLLTPNWMTKLPGAPYEGDDPDGFMTAAETVATLEEYRRLLDPPLHTGIMVKATCQNGTGFEVLTTEGTWRCDAVVAATGGSSEPRVPAFASDLPQSVQQLTSLSYRRPAQIDDRGRVLVVGASASGVQIADELRRAGRDVTISVGEHVRLPRSYRGFDIYRWLDHIGQLDERCERGRGPPTRARRHASVQVVGSDHGRDVDLPSLQGLGVQLVGRLMAIRGTTAFCSGGLGSLVANADLKQARLLRRIDEWIYEHDMADLVGPATEPRPTVLDPGANRAGPAGLRRGDLGDRLPSRVRLAGSTCVRPPKPRRPRRRRCEHARPLPAGSPLPAAASFEPARGVGLRRGRALPAPRRLPRGRCTCAHQDVTLNPGSAGANERTSGSQHNVLDGTGGAGRKQVASTLGTH